jgi:hypothetical protein
MGPKILALLMYAVVAATLLYVGTRKQKLANNGS